MSQQQWVKLARERLGFNTKQFADALGVNRVTAHGWESGRYRMSKQARRALAFLLEHQERGSLVSALARARRECA